MMNRKSFTLTEIMTTIILIGLLAAFALPDFVKSAGKAVERNGIVNLRMIYSAREWFNVQTGNYPPAMGNLQQINTTLGLEIIDNSLTYSCVAGAGECVARDPRSGWRLHFHNPQDRIHCREGNPACPSCQTFAGGGCINGEI